MKCSRCKKNEATVYYKQNINGEIKEYALCGDCARAEELDISIPFAHLNLFTGMPIEKKAPEKKRCDLCGSSFDDIRKSGKAGCGRCYSTFADEFKNTIAYIHGTSVHVKEEKEGKKPDEITSLKAELQKAIANEEYEKAAELRDKIRELEGR